ncbi:MULTISPECIES: hypothetical protein [Clostridium]|uniref:Uncharacterized protein n=1 Tax=Clostridium saccharoperbutylacetonicum N1-4(HMT) TaxID=931276 RepID=M1MIW4_9CLOT|nr:hypothetical protein [Clostridium saccharoperbutylacetonicum]AGF56248.1 hypothetical protein Cspa_c24830 [Clostridium saccharoperbutylacetonicum N1-4(HMT)]AQR94988.1 hypothetical protein CLSAP_23020 [Clostridium saccharoperbutylacetonicum]NRT63009.1 hypothetical protein [Clostridium saccharoperbutylacetonicum]NSB26366.1 hypothetical protein [Clostridium saccharoperbutylacetonicum]NSB30831.1 hypothetical protein [Clostridium saccharoperbutylacetonicum]
MKIRGIKELTNEELNYELQVGGKFVIYQYCISIGIMTFKRGSDIYFVKKDESTFVKGLGYTLLTLVAGWWGIPWGPIYTIGALYRNCSGGKDITAEVVNSFRGEQQQYQPAID